METELKENLVIMDIVIVKRVENNWDDSVNRNLNKLWEI